MLDKLTAIQQKISSSLDSIKILAELANFRVQTLGRKGELTRLLKAVGSLPPEERKELGKKVNEIRDQILSEIENKKAALEASALAESLITETIDVTLPGKTSPAGSLHPVTQFMWRLEELFISLGFDIVEGSLIETVYHNFDALNTPHNHPSRDEGDTFYIDETHVLRTHTSPMQVRTMERQKPPIRVIVPGMVSRRDEIDATHTPVFHQMEGLVIDRGITFADLRGMLDTIVRYVFGQEAKVRLRPSHFPFTEPSAEVDISCYACVTSKPGKLLPPKDDCSVCKGSGWVELWGCGMVHPEVLRKSGIDPSEYSGYAFGLGVTRMTSALYGIPTLKPYFENDVQFLKQF
ncbi:MAG: phenylalanine--tRNA ligase subunit alpha [Defluviitaleaceae bacterium]|nr:phenylalanine--tRNA ligase subunit alpha [Defluviitaleaceae bacterium]